MYNARALCLFSVIVPDVVSSRSSFQPHPLFAQRLRRASAGCFSRDPATSRDRADLYFDADTDPSAHANSHADMDAIADAQPYCNGDLNPIADPLALTNAAAVYPHAGLKRGRAGAFRWSDTRPVTD